MELFREALRREMDAAGIRQPQASERTGLSQAIISQYLKGTRSPDKLSVWGKLIRAFPRLVFNLLEAIYTEMRG